MRFCAILPYTNTRFYYISLQISLLGLVGSLGVPDTVPSCLLDRREPSRAPGVRGGHPVFLT